MVPFTMPGLAYTKVSKQRVRERHKNAGFSKTKGHLEMGPWTLELSLVSCLEIFIVVKRTRNLKVPHSGHYTDPAVLGSDTDCYTSHKPQAG